MYNRKQASQLAARVRSLLGNPDRATVLLRAIDLDVPVGDLREIVEHETQYPSVAVLARLVAEYGVDAGWLLTGEYSPSLHRAAEEFAEPAKSRVAKLLGELDSPYRGS